MTDSTTSNDSEREHLAALVDTVAYLFGHHEKRLKVAQELLERYNNGEHGEQLTDDLIDFCEEEIYGGCDDDT